MKINDVAHLTIERDGMETILNEIPKYPNYMVVHDLSKDELYSLADSVRSSNVFVIPIYTKSVDEMIDFSDYNPITHSEYIVRPFYVGDNKELEREIVKRSIDDLYKGFEEADYWFPLKELVCSEIEEKGWKETMRVKYPNSI